MKMPRLADKAREASQVDSDESRECINEYYKFIQQEIMLYAAAQQDHLIINRLKVPQRIPSCKRIFESDDYKTMEFINKSLDKALREDGFEVTHRGADNFFMKFFTTRINW